MRRGMMAATREGFSLIEALVAMVLLSVVLMALAPVLLGAVDRQRADAFRLERTGILMAQANRLMAMPFDQLAVQNDTSISDPYVHDYAVEIDVVASSGVQLLVKVKVTPGAPGIEPDSVQFWRTQP